MICECQRASITLEMPRRLLCSLWRQASLTKRRFFSFQSTYSTMVCERCTKVRGAFAYMNGVSTNITSLHRSYRRWQLQTRSLLLAVKWHQGLAKSRNTSCLGTREARNRGIRYDIYIYLFLSIRLVEWPDDHSRMVGNVKIVNKVCHRIQLNTVMVCTPTKLTL